MSIQDLTKTAEILEKRISVANRDTRLALQPQFTAVLARLKANGQPVPNRMQRLDACLVDEAIEAQFDNMPV